MSNTRPQLSEAEFERLAAHREPNWWAVGEKLAFAPEILAVEGWNVPGSPGNLRLTPAQRDLLAWVVVVRDGTFGSISDFFFESRQMLAAAELAISHLGWPELQRNYMAAARAFMTVNGKPVTAAEWAQEEKDNWERLRDEARRFQRKNGLEPATGADLDRAVMRMQMSGLIAMKPHREHEAVNRFDNWFQSEETKIASERYVSSFIRRNRDELARIV